MKRYGNDNFKAVSCFEAKTTSDLNLRQPGNPGPKH